MSFNLRNWLNVSAACLFTMGLLFNIATAETNVGNAPFANTTNAQLPLAGVELNIAMSMQPPFSFISESMSEVQGIDAEIVKELQKRTGFKLVNNRINFMHFSEMMGLAMDGKIDVVAGGVSLTEARRQYFDFSEPHLAAPVVLVSRNGSDIYNVEDMANHTLAVERGAAAASLIPHANEMNISVNESSSNFMCVYAVHDQKADALVMDEPMAAFYINNWKDSNLRIVENLSQPGMFGFLFKKGEKYTVHLQDAFHDMIEDGTMERIIVKHLGEDLTKEYIANLNRAPQTQTALNRTEP